MNDSLILIEFLRNESRCDDILLVICEVGKKTDALQAFAILVVVTNDDFFNSFAESLSIDQPQTNLFLRPNRASPCRIIQQS